MAGTLETLNGNACSWAEVEITADVVGGGSFPDIDWKSMDAESKVDRGVQRGPGGQVKKKTTGQPTDTASASLYRSGLKALKRALVAVAPQDAAGRYQLSKVRFNIVVKHSVDDDPDINILKFLGCTLDKNAYKMAEGPDADVVDIDLNPMKIIEVIDGKETVLL